LTRYQRYKPSEIDWVGVIPSHWETVKPKYKLNRVTRPFDHDDEVVTCFRDGVVTLRKNRREGGFTNSIKEHGYQQIRPGDLVVHEMDGFEGAIGISDSRGKSTPVYTVIEPDQRVDLRYINYLLREMSKTGKIESLARSIRERTTDFRWNMWSEIHFPFPPIKEQQLISRYLDKKTEQIDSLVKKIQKKIELLKEQRTSLINQCVTKGLDPNVEMKDSGVEWIGEIPSHWDVSPMFSLFNENKEKNKEGRLDILTLSYGKIKYRDLSKLQGLFPESFNGYQVMNIESIIIRSTDLQNDHKSLRVGHVGTEGVITSAYLGLNPKENNSTKFYYYSIHLADLKKVLYGLGGGLRQSLRYDDFKRFPIINPPKDERQRISKQLDELDKKTTNIIKKYEKYTTLLREYRQSLVSSVVTGKVRITEDMI
jgi:type I restriction enzyme, S subunit